MRKAQMNQEEIVKVADKEISVGGFWQTVQDIQQLIKLRLTLTVVFSSILAYLIAVQGPINWVAVLILAMGGLLVTGAANTLNQVLEKDFDRLMERTKDRPLAAGRMKISEAVLYAGFMSLFGISLLAMFNPWTAFLGTFSLVSYAFVYTPMKRVSPDAVTIGAIPGALPTLIGVVAAQGQLTWLGFSLFAIQFLWQFPHFWSIGFLGYEDYSKAGYKLIPEKNGKISLNKLGKQAFACTLVLIAVSFAPLYLSAVGIISTIIVAFLGLGYAWFAWKFWQNPERKTALSLMFYSFAYIPLSLILFWVDKV